MSNKSVMRIINVSADSKAENHAKVKKHVEYVLNPKSTARELQYFNMVSRDNPVEYFGYFARSHSKDDGRVLKHLIVSFKAKEKLAWEDYLSATQKIARFFNKEYQIVASVHNNIPQRPHAHILIDCFNIKTEKKFSEGPNEFWNLVGHINAVLKEFNMYPLLQGLKKNNVSGDIPDTVIEEPDLSGHYGDTRFWGTAPLYNPECPQKQYVGIFGECNVPEHLHQCDITHRPVNDHGESRGVKDDFSPFFPDKEDEQTINDIQRIAEFLKLDIY